MGRSRIMLAVGFAVLVVLAVYFGLNRNAEDEVAEGSSSLPTRTERSDEGRVPDGRVARAREAREQTERQVILAELKDRWAELKPRGNAAIAEQDALSYRSAKQLQCSEECIALMVCLNGNGQRYGSFRLRLDLEGTLKSPDGSKWREQLTKLPAFPSGLGKDAHHLIQQLCNAAGQGCSVEEFEEFSLALQSDAFAQEATLGRNRVLMRSDPKAGILSTLEILKRDVHSLSKWDHLNRQMREKLPEGVDFAELEGVLPESDGAWKGSVPNRNPVASGRQVLMKNWAKLDLDAAANHVLQHPERLDPVLLQTVAGAAKFANVEEAVAWVDGFEEGPYFDQAAMGTIFYLHHYDQSKASELARRIGDPELRAEAVKKADRAPLREEGG